MEREGQAQRKNQGRKQFERGEGVKRQVQEDRIHKCKKVEGGRGWRRGREKGKGKQGTRREWKEKEAT